MLKIQGEIKLASSTTSAVEVINRTAQVGLDSVTVDDIVDAATRVGAPMTSNVSTNNGMVRKSKDSEEYFPYSVTFSWSEG